jgi:hypothetical protein
MSASDVASETPVGRCAKAMLTILIALSHGEDWLARLKVLRKSRDTTWSILQFTRSDA